MTSYTFSQIEPLLNGLLAAVLTIKINFFEVHLCFENQYCQYNVYYLNIISDFNFWQEIILIFHLRGALQMMSHFVLMTHRLSERANG